MRSVRLNCLIALSTAFATAAAAADLRRPQQDQAPTCFFGCFGSAETAEPPAQSEAAEAPAPDEATPPVAKRRPRARIAVARPSPKRLVFARRPRPAHEGRAVAAARRVSRPAPATAQIEPAVSVQETEIGLPPAGWLERAQPKPAPTEPAGPFGALPR